MSVGKIVIERPRIVTSTQAQPGGGVHCCCCTCCTCVNLQVLWTIEGKLKMLQVGIGVLCQGLVISYGMGHAQNLGPAYDSFLTTVSSCLMTSALLLASYVFSARSKGFLRSSLFETLYNFVATFLYLSTSSYMTYAVYFFLRPLYIITPFFQVYPAMTAAYILGLVLAILHGYDGYLALKQFRRTM